MMELFSIFGIELLIALPFYILMVWIGIEIIRWLRRH